MPPIEYIVTCHALNGMRRAGIAWPAGRTQAPLDPKALERLQADPAFTVQSAAAPADRAAVILAAIPGLAPEDFTQDGPPKLAPLRKAARLADITDAERDTAWAAHQAANTE